MKDPTKIDLVFLVARLSKALREAKPEHPLPGLAYNYLEDRQLIGSPLRTDRSETKTGLTWEEWRDTAARSEAEAAQQLLQTYWDAAFKAGKDFVKISSALSRIDYLLGEPNDMRVSQYDIDYDENSVVARVERFIADSKERESEAYRKGQEEMRERAAYKADTLNESRLGVIGNDLRALEIKDGE